MGKKSVICRCGHILLTNHLSRFTISVYQSVKNTYSLLFRYHNIVAMYYFLGIIFGCLYLNFTELLLVLLLSLDVLSTGTLWIVWQLIHEKQEGFKKFPTAIKSRSCSNVAKIKKNILIYEVNIEAVEIRIISSMFYTIRRLSCEGSCAIRAVGSASTARMADLEGRRHIYATAEISASPRVPNF